MEYIPGDNLEDRLDQHGGPFEIELVVSWAAQLLETFEYLHSRQVYHRDVKPANVKIGRNNRLYLLDFGIAKAETLTKNSVTAWTPPYASPEQWDNAPTDARSDIYSLGATLYELLADEPPDSPYIRQKELLIGREDPLRPLTMRNTTVSPELAAIIGRALEISPEQRYQQAADMLVDLRAFYPRLQPVSAVEPVSSPAPRSGRHTLRVILIALISILGLLVMVATLPQGLAFTLLSPRAAAAETTTIVTRDPATATARARLINATTQAEQLSTVQAEQTATAQLTETVIVQEQATAAAAAEQTAETRALQTAIARQAQTATAETGATAQAILQATNTASQAATGTAAVLATQAAAQQATQAVAQQATQVAIARATSTAAEQATTAAQATAAAQIPLLNGTWSGSTSMGGRITFEIGEDRVQRIVFAYPSEGAPALVGACEGVSPFTGLESTITQLRIPIRGDASFVTSELQISGVDRVLNAFNGRYDGASGVFSGSLRETFAISSSCQSVSDFTWTATRQ